MKEGIQDKVLKNVLRIHRLTVDKIQTRTKGQRPFASTPVNPDELIYAYETLGSEDPMTLIQEYGQEAVNKLFYEIAMMKHRRIKNGSIQATQRTVQEANAEAPQSFQAPAVPQNPVLTATKTQGASNPLVRTF